MEQILKQNKFGKKFWVGRVGVRIDGAVTEDRRITPSGDVAVFDMTGVYCISDIGDRFRIEAHPLSDRPPLWFLPKHLAIFRKFVNDKWDLFAHRMDMNVIGEANSAHKGEQPAEIVGEEEIEA